MEFCIQIVILMQLLIVGRYKECVREEITSTKVRVRIEVNKREREGARE